MSPHHPVSSAMADLIRNAAIEVIPLKGAEEKVKAVPAGTTVTITCSPKFGLERTLEHSAQAARAGYRVVPHLAARQVADETELRDFVGRLTDLGITRLYVIGGDADVPAGKFSEAAEILEALSGMDHGLTSIGVGCYPEGHPKIADEALLTALRRKQPYAHYMVSQLCFDPAALVAWLRRTRESGITLPLHIGLAAPMNTRKLAELSLRIGVGSSLRYLSKQRGLVGNMIRGDAYQPERLLLGMGDALTDPDLKVSGIHLYSFNQVEATVDWQRRVTEQAA
ncbi:methylenetetrahydrofolate reductase [Streptomyces sp. NPDC059477]|uniref:methylenetetrahydrofolate reductase n=1 Tax=Streptomyces sp. NPDC059477 TaxID=3346847 RepID=UPI0036743C63